MFRMTKQVHICDGTDEDYRKVIKHANKCEGWIMAEDEFELMSNYLGRDKLRFKVAKTEG